MKICWIFPYSSISIATLSQVCVFKKNNNNNPNVLHKYQYQFYIPILKNKINYKYLAYILDKTSDVL